MGPCIYIYIYIYIYTVCCSSGPKLTRRGATTHLHEDLVVIIMIIIVITP